MAKTKTVYVCQNCGVESPKWIGRCNSCGEWNTFVEEKIVKTASTHSTRSTIDIKPSLIKDITSKKTSRIKTSDDEFDRVLGGGLVPGTMILVGGEPGIGKSTLLLQMALVQTNTTLYVSGEESAEQIKLRADRLGYEDNKCYIYSETNLEKISNQIKNTEAKIVVIDSIQTVYTETIESSPGSVSQTRECSAKLLRIAKETGVTIILIGHINKDGNIAGPKILEHIVDTVLQFEGDRNYIYRILRTTKNRFGSASELGVYEMQSSGLKGINNPSELFLAQNNTGLSGVTTAATIEGFRPFLVEIQALVSSAAYGTPQRSSPGYDIRRLNMLLAVLEKRAGFRLSIKDVFLNIAGGIKVNDPAIDLAVVCSVLSSDQDICIDNKTCFAGEVGLSGEIRPVNRIEQRILEAEKLGFEVMYVPFGNHKIKQNEKLNIRLKTVKKINEVFSSLFG